MLRSTPNAGRQPLTLAITAWLLAVLTASTAAAQEVPADDSIESITVTARRWSREAEVPGTSVAQTAAALRSQNLINPEDALKYAPNLTIRKRFVGDRNALIGGRSFSPLQAPRALVLMDGYVLSNFLGRYDAPRWNMIAPEEISRVDILYGPFSAIYPGNSIGTTVVVTTRKPTELAMGVRTTAFAERFSEYSLNDDYSGHQLSGYFGDRFANETWWSLALNRQDAVSHPMQYYTVAANAAGAFPATQGAAPATPVSGVIFDVDPQGRRRAVFGTSAGAIDHAVQNQIKLRGGWAPSALFEAEAFIALWRSDARGTNRTFMRDVQGREVWSGRVIADGILFDVPASALAPTRRDESHLQWGATLRTWRSGWNGSLVYSQYAIRRDALHEASTPDPLAEQGGAGMVTRRDGTGWRTVELQALAEPFEAAWSLGTHTLTLGVHRNEYRLRNPAYRAADWRDTTGELVRNVGGETRTHAAYVQDLWIPAEQWSVTLGARFEWWSAFNGRQRAGDLAVDYPDRSLHATSPKASIAFEPDGDWLVRLSAGRGVRFPTVAELFQGTASANAITINDPNLRAEVSDSIELAVERSVESGTIRASLFEDDVRDSIFNQTNIAVRPAINNVQNVDRVRSRGAELAFDVAWPGLESLRLSGNLAYVRSRILANRNNVTYEGNDWPRVPRWRGALQATWRPTAAWLASVAVRHSGRMYGRLENDDVNGDVYGGISRFTLVDARLAYTFDRGIELALGVDNLTNARAYQSHPYPGRTGVLEARWSLGEPP